MCVHPAHPTEYFRPTSRPDDAVASTGMDTTREPLRLIQPPLPVTVDLTSGYGPRRIRWGTDTPQWVRASGFYPERSQPAVAEAHILSMYGDWWVQVRTTLVDQRGRPVREVGLLLPSTSVHHQAPTTTPQVDDHD
jgi:hypothetical protein